jgi:hypothetical protein
MCRADRSGEVGSRAHPDKASPQTCPADPGATEIGPRGPIVIQINAPPYPDRT